VTRTSAELQKWVIRMGNLAHALSVPGAEYAAMTDSIPRRMTAEIEGDFVVFLIGMKVTRLWKIQKWWPVFRAMRPMIKELSERPESGFLGCTFGFPVIVQYWRSFDHLEAYARSHDNLHWPAWVAFNKRSGQSRGDVGIWHETYKVAAGQYEAVYSGMPPFGLGKVGELVPTSGRRETARGRIGAVDEANREPALEAEPERVRQVSGDGFAPRVRARGS